jgi:HD-GYP domain-containing protein (c-di-GMP phosphodiesterase class II)
MRLLSISQCRPGMKLGKNIYNEEGRVLLGIHMELTSTIIQRLANFGVDFIYVFDDRTEDVLVPDMIHEETRIKTIATIRNSFSNMMTETHNRRSSNRLSKDFRNVLDMIIDDISSHNEGMIMLMNLNLTDQYLFQHSMNVCVFACMIGMSKKYSRDELTTFGLGALLHDVGKTQVPLAILNKKEQLTNEEFDIIKKHAEAGYKLLKDEPNIPLLTAHCAFQHHERLDGSGYPRGIKGSEIHDYAQWIGLVDSFDAMTTHRVYRKTMLPHQAIEVIYTGSGTLFDKEKIEIFRDKVAMYPIGVSVKLHSGEGGIVVGINPSCPQRPILRIFEDQEGQSLHTPYEIDLAKHLSAMIVDINYDSDHKSGTIESNEIRE